jgi:hypothetical protein
VASKVELLQAVGSARSAGKTKNLRTPFQLTILLSFGNGAKLAFGQAWNRVNHVQNTLRVT